jgi:hypothetical protein
MFTHIFMINLAISPLVKPTDIGGSVAMRLTPYRVFLMEVQ